MKRVYLLYGASGAGMLGALAAGLLPSPAVPAAVLILLALAALAGGTALLLREQRLSTLLTAEQNARNELLLRQAELEAEAAKKTGRAQILQFHSKVSHCFRLPFSVIQGYADLLKGDMLTDPEVRAEYLGRISDKVMYLNELLGQLLLEARAEAGIPSLRLERFDLCTLARQTAAEISPAARMMDISVSVTCAEEQIPVTADQSLLRKVIYNILGNSLKYMNRSGSINITVSRADEQALLIFKDDGLGMDAQEAEHVFELSYQGSNKKSGDGFGLYYAKSGIQAHGGAIQAKSAPGQGMGIYITLPVMGPAQQEPEHEPEPEGLRESLEIIST